MPRRGRGGAASPADAGGNCRHKGIFIVDSAYTLALEQPPDPFGSNFRETAADHDLVAVTVATLLE